MSIHDALDLDIALPNEDHVLDGTAFQRKTSSAAKLQKCVRVDHREATDRCQLLPEGLHVVICRF